jgi:transcriptional regulator with XRE-family HTH domain
MGSFITNTMASLPHYLRSNRMRLGLTQDDVAFLLGVKGGEKLSRYERFNRKANLRVALACEIIFERAVSEIFNGLYQQIEAEIRARAKLLAKTPLAGAHARRRRKVIENIAEA